MTHIPPAGTTAASITGSTLDHFLTETDKVLQRFLTERGLETCGRQESERSITVQFVETTGQDGQVKFQITNESSKNIPSSCIQRQTIHVKKVK